MLSDPYLSLPLMTKELIIAVCVSQAPHWVSAGFLLVWPMIGSGGRMEGGERSQGNSLSLPVPRVVLLAAVINLAPALVILSSIFFFSRVGQVEFTVVLISCLPLYHLFGFLVLLSSVQ